MSYRLGARQGDPQQPRRWRAAPRALRTALARRARHLLDQTPTDCPLCAGRSRGGRPCTGCVADIQAHAPAHRCQACAHGLPYLAACPNCAGLAPAFDRVVTAFDYQAPADQLVQQLKNTGKFWHARFMAAMLAEAVRQATPQIDGITIVLPVPSSPQALRRRGFNPAAEVGRLLAARLQWPYQQGLVRQLGDGVSQKSLNRAARLDQSLQRFACTRRIDGAVVAVVDDVLTTGATLHGVALALKQAGAASVTGLVVARTP